VTDRVSVIIPAYNGTQFLGQAITSVLEQTYTDFEIIVVDDCSTDGTAKVAKQFADPRVQYIRHENNRGAVAARQTGIRVSSGEIIALLDQDDLFHPAKLATHVAFLQAQPAVGVSYNARFELRDGTRTICGLWQPPRALTLADLISGFPISPSDTVLRRAWAVRDEIWDDSFARDGGQVIFNGQEIVFGGRLALAGCRFGNVGRALNYRRYHSGRVFSKLAAKCRAELACQDMILNDPRCPADVTALRDTAHANLLLIWSYLALVQQEFDLGYALLSEALTLRPTLVKGAPCELVEFWAATSAADKRMELETLLERLMRPSSVSDARLPPELARLTEQYEWAVGRGYLLKGAHAAFWEQPAEANRYFEQAALHHAQIDQVFAQGLVTRLMDYEAEFGAAATRAVLQRLTPFLEKIGGRSSPRRVLGNYWIQRAFASYQSGERNRVPGSVLRGVVNDPKYLVNRGVGAILLYSLVQKGAA